MSKPNVSRRMFLSKSASSAILGAMGAMGVAGVARAADSVGTAHAPDWQETFEIVIVGSGFAGLAAAYSALENGAKRVLVLEKMPVFGGNSVINAGQVSLAGSGMQKAKGIKDSPELFKADMLRAGNSLNHQNLVDALVAEAPACYDMMVASGVKLRDEVIRLGGHSAPRTIFADNYSGGGICVPMHKHLRDKGVAFRNRSFVENIFLDKTGRATGVSVVPDYDFDARKGGKAIAVRATKGIVIASGGWGSDHEFISASMPPYATLKCTSQKGATSEMLRLLLGLGAMPVMLDTYQIGPWACPDEFGAGAASIFADYIFAEGIMVDARNGKRFVNELASRRVRSEAEMKCVDQKGNPVFPFGFCSEETTKDRPGFAASLREGTTKRTESVEELAKLYGAPVDALKAQIDEWNRYVENGRDEAFGKPIDRKLLLKPPFYSIRFWPKLHYCMGGVGITEKGEVLSFRTLKPIPGLYAAGEITGGVHGADRLGSCSSTDCLAFGRIAGRNAALNRA